MDFRDRLRDKFRPEKKPKDSTPSSVRTQMSALDDGDDWSSSEEKYEVIEDGAALRRRNLSDCSSHGSGGASAKKDLESLSSHSEASNLQRPLSGMTIASTGSWGDNERSIYELQLQNLQEQLMDITIKNQDLAIQLNKYKQDKDTITLLKDLDHEKQKNEELIEHCRDMEDRLARVRRQNSHEGGGSIDIGEEAASVEFTDSGDSPSKPLTKSRWFCLKAWCVDKFYVLMADLSDETEEETNKAEEEELSVKVLKENIKRARAGYEPLGQWMGAIRRLKSWQSPSATGIAFCIYMYASYHGWLISLLLGLLLWHLSKTYLIANGWDVKFSLLPYEEPNISSELDKSLGLSDKFQLVVVVAKKVQHLAGDLADSLEKLNNLVMWGNPEVTRKLYTTVLAMFVTSLILPTQWIFTLCAMFMGYKLFITDNLYAKFPRMRAKYDSGHIMWKLLPTHEQLSRNRVISQRQTYVVVNPGDNISDEVDPQAPENKAFCELFSLPATEYPLPGWEDGKRTYLLNKEKPTNFKNGRIYLTKNFLCFERTRSRKSLTSKSQPTGQNIVIPLTEITKLEKAKPFTFIPGMSIEVLTPSAEKPYLFGGILGRDEVYAAILKEMERAQHLQQRRGSDDIKKD